MLIISRKFDGMDSCSLTILLLLISADHVYTQGCEKLLNQTKSPFLTIIIDSYFNLNVINHFQLKRLNDINFHNFYFVTSYDCEDLTVREQLLRIFLDMPFAETSFVLQVISFFQEYQTNIDVANLLLPFNIPFFVVISSRYVDAAQTKEKLSHQEFRHVKVINYLKHHSNANSIFLMLNNISHSAIMFDSDNFISDVTSLEKTMNDCKICMGPKFKVTNKLDIEKAFDYIISIPEIYIINSYLQDQNLFKLLFEKVKSYNRQDKVWVVYNEWFRDLDTNYLLSERNRKSNWNISLILYVYSYSYTMEHEVLFEIANLTFDKVSNINIENSTLIDQNTRDSISESIIEFAKYFLSDEGNQKQEDKCSISSYNSGIFKQDILNRKLSSEDTVKVLQGILMNSNKCKELCHPGYSSHSIGNSTCRFTCSSCPKHFYQNKYGRFKCSPCVVSQTNNSDHSGCISLPKRFVKITSATNIVATCVVSLFGMSVSLLILIVFVKNRNTPVVRSSNVTLSYVQIILHIVLYLTFFAFFISETKLRMFIYNITTGLLFSAILSIYLAKTFKLLAIFNASQRLDSPHIFQVKEMSIILSVVFINALTSGYIYATVDEKTKRWRDDSKLVFYEAQDSAYLLQAELIYLILLSFICGIYSYKLRHLPSTYNEGTYIAPAMFTLTFELTVTFVIHDVYLGKESVYVATAIMMSIANTTTICINYFYKVYIILICPKRNTREYFSQKRLKNSIAEM